MISTHTPHSEPQSRSFGVCVHVPLLCGALAERANHEFPSFGSSEGFLVGNVGKNDESQIQNEFYGPKLSVLWTRHELDGNSRIHSFRLRAVGLGDCTVSNDLEPVQTLRKCSNVM